MLVPLPRDALRITGFLKARFVRADLVDFIDRELAVDAKLLLLGCDRNREVCDALVMCQPSLLRIPMWKSDIAHRDGPSPCLFVSFRIFSCFSKQ